MLNENAKKWVAALRSGKYKQGKHKLHRNDTFCCLGVACELAMESGAPVNTVKVDDFFSYNGENNYLPETVRRWLGLATENGSFKRPDGRWEKLAVLNDDGATFEEIVEIIENEPKGLFES